MSVMPPYLENKDEDSDSQESYVDINAEINDWDLPIVLDEPRHNEPIKGEERVEQSWRLKEKYKTHCVALVLCLNVGVDPPDVVKTQPCARVECWIDPHSLSSSKALESIGHALQLQYERWQPRARYKQSLDPTCEEVKKLCCSLRRNAKDERVLFHYNGHGVPKPTAQGEIWVFNKTYTQYIPLSMYDLQSWMGAPSLYVYDCSNAGVILDCFKTFAEQHERDYQMSGEGGAAGGSAGGAAGSGGGSAGSGGSAGGVSFRNCVQLGACAAGQTLPMNPELPADLFTSCLTTPVKCALKWFVLRGSAAAPAAAAAATQSALLLDLIDKIPGQVTDRRTMLGELNWIFTAITDTIAWNSLPPELFQQLFRADLLTASLCRNFLLADRIMRCYNCTPVSSPALPPLGTHPLWGAWEHTLELALAQLPRLLGAAPPAGPPGPYRHAPFFQDHLRAFRLWLRLPPSVGGRAPPAQLPLVLQVLLSTAHRVPALALLCRYLGHARSAVGHVLRVGVFPYTLKLLQASAAELQPPMLYIWSHIIAYDPSCQVDLVNAKGHKYFLAVLSDPAADSEQKAMALFVLAGIVDNYPAGQEAALNGSMISLCLEVVSCGGVSGGAGGTGGADTWARWALTWACCALGRVWRGHVAARAAAARDLAHEKLLTQGGHNEPVVRASVAWALGRLLAAGSGAARSDHSTALDHHVAVALCARALHDASPLVRHETLAALQWLVLIFEQYFIAVATQEKLRKPDKSVRGRVDPGQDALEHKRALSAAPPAPPLPTIGFGSVYAKIWSCISALCGDPAPRVRKAALALTHHVTSQVEAVSELEFEVVRHNSGGSPDTRQHSLTRGHRRVKSLVQSTISEDSTSPRDRDHRDSTSSSTGSSSCMKKAIVTTELMEWVTGVFMRSVRAARVTHNDDTSPPTVATSATTDDHNERAVRGAAQCVGGGGGGDGGGDPEARDTHERQWRYARNRELRHHMQRLRAGGTRRVEGVAFTARAGAAVSVLAFHPYCQQLCVATRDQLAAWDWGAAARLCTWSVGGGAGAAGEESRVTSLCYVNAHERALAAAATANGDVMLFRVGQSSSVSAWHALDVRRAPRPPPPPAAPHYSLGFSTLVPEQFLGDERGSPPAAAPPTDSSVWAEAGVSLQYDERRALLAAGGNAPAVSLWDLATETRANTLPTEGGVGVTSLWWSGWRLACGLADGAARVVDTRTHTRAAHAHTHTARHHAPLRLAALRDDLYSLVTVCALGVVQVWDTRGSRSAPLHVSRAPALVHAASAHPAADMLALACSNQSISILDLRGQLSHSIRFHEGFMGARIPPPHALAFHPLRVALGVGSKDSTVSVYVAERR